MILSQAQDSRLAPPNSSSLPHHPVNEYTPENRLARAILVELTLKTWYRCILQWPHSKSPSQEKAFRRDGHKRMCTGMACKSGSTWLELAELRLLGGVREELLSCPCRSLFPHPWHYGESQQWERQDQGTVCWMAECARLKDYREKVLRVSQG